MNSRTLRDAWNAFEYSSPKDLSLYQSALFRFSLPGLGGRKPSGARLTSKEIAASLKILASISISSDIEERLREAQKETFALLNTPKKRQRQLRYYLNQFIDWNIKKEFFPSAKLSEEKSQYIFYPKKTNHIKTRKPREKKFSFSFNVNDYVAEPLQSEQLQQHLQRINQEFISFRKYQTTNQDNREPTAEKHERQLKLILGWFYREKSVPLAEISLNKLVPFIRLDFQIREFDFEENPWLSQIIAKAKALENIKDEARHLVDVMREFFGWLRHTPSIGTKQLYIDALIAYAKYVYRHETDETMAVNFEDIPIINRLRVFHNEVKSSKRSNSNIHNKYLPWTDVLDVIKGLRLEADLETIKAGNQRINRALSAKAKSLQDFVLLGFFVLIPPSRQRVIRELELGRTLKYGIFFNGQFTPVEKMTNSSEAKYYIHLQPEDYKTGDIYKEWIGEFPNTEFPDGSKFYDYLNRWLFRGYQDKNGDWHGMREVIAAPSVKTVLVGENLGKPYDIRRMGQKIKNIFTRWTGVPISPQDLRHLYRTYIDDPATGATAEEKESAAFWMRHSSRTAKKIYSHLKCEQKLRLGAQMSQRLNQQLLNGWN